MWFLICLVEKISLDIFLQYSLLKGIIPINLRWTDFRAFFESSSAGNISATTSGWRPSVTTKFFRN